MNYFEEITPQERADLILKYCSDSFDSSHDVKVASLLCARMIKVHCPKYLAGYWEAVISILIAS